MTLMQAMADIRGGAKFGDVFPELDDEADRAELRGWYVGADRVPANPVRPAPAKQPPAAPAPSGDLCPACGGLMVRTGTCTTCSSCGTSSGGCG